MGSGKPIFFPAAGKGDKQKALNQTDSSQNVLFKKGSHGNQISINSQIMNMTDMEVVNRNKLHEG